MKNRKEISANKRSTFKSCALFLNDIWKISPISLVTVIVMGLADTVSYVTACFYSKYMIEAVLYRNPLLAIIIVASIRVGVHFFWNILSTILEDIIGSIQQTKIKRHFVSQIYKKMTLIDMAQFENTEFYSKLSRTIEQAEERPVLLLGTIRKLFSTFFTVLGLFTTFFILSPISVLVSFLGGFITFLIYFINSKLEYNYYVDKAETQRIFDYIKRIFYMPQYKNDIHYFNVSEVFLNKYHENTQKQCAVIRKHTPRIIRLKLLTTFLSVGINVGFACFFVVNQIINGDLRIGDFSAAVAAITALGNCLFSFGMTFPQFKEHAYSINDYLDILNYQSELYSPTGIDISQEDMKKIEFKDVSFGYN